MHTLKRCLQMLKISLVDPLVRDIGRLHSERANPIYQVATLVGDENALGTAVTRVRTPLDEARFLQAVDHSRRRDRLDFEQLCQPALLDAFVAQQDREDLPLRARDAHLPRAFVE